MMDKSGVMGRVGSSLVLEIVRYSKGESNQEIARPGEDDPSIQ